MLKGLVHSWKITNCPIEPPVPIISDVSFIQTYISGPSMKITIFIISNYNSGQLSSTNCASRLLIAYKERLLLFQILLGCIDEHACITCPMWMRKNPTHSNLDAKFLFLFKQKTAVFCCIILFHAKIWFECIIERSKSIEAYLYDVCM